MKVLLINGSPHERGSTYTALKVVADELNAQGVDTEIAWIGLAPVRGCAGCGGCLSNRCLYDDDIVNRLLERAEKADGFVFGSPVYFASANGALIAIMDRMFAAAGDLFMHKAGAVISVARRAGTTATYDQLNKYVEISEMIMPPACYWNVIHGTTPDEVMRDEEGVAIMRSAASGLAWVLRLIELGKANGLSAPLPTPRAQTNFIR